MNILTKSAIAAIALISTGLTAVPATAGMTGLSATAQMTEQTAGDYVAERDEALQKIGFRGRGFRNRRGGLRGFKRRRFGGFAKHKRHRRFRHRSSWCDSRNWKPKYCKYRAHLPRF